MAANSYEKPDYWSKKAFSEGYPARSVYKLQEIDDKFGMIKKNFTILDLGAAPGSWTTFLLRKLDGSGKVVSCDLNPLAKSVKGDNLVFIQGDLNAAEIRKQITENGPYDLVVCDAAPLTTGNKMVDTARSAQLVEMAVEKGRSVRPELKCGICGEHGGEPSSVKFCHKAGLNYVSCSPFRVPIARLAAAQAAIEE